MLGLDARTGALISGDEHLRQSITDILSTPIGSRVMRRDYGSALLELVDQPIHPTTVLRLYAAIATALARWEPRLRLRQVKVAQGDRPGAITIDLEGERTEPLRRGEIARLTLPLLIRSAEPPTVTQRYAQALG